jgi:uncharacterized protein YceH (UPF0502 family)
MEPKLSKETAALIKTLLYEELETAQELGNRDATNAALDAINEVNRFLDREYANL